MKINKIDLNSRHNYEWLDRVSSYHHLKTKTSFDRRITYSVCGVTLLLVLSSLSILWHCTESSLVQGTNSFALNLLKEISPQNEENLIYSPVCISTVLSMLQQGAQGTSAVQLQNIVGVGKDESRTSYNQILESVRSRESKSTLLFGNHAFIKSSFELNQDFQQIIQNDFKSGVESIDYKEKEVAAEKINSWVANVTNNRIQNLITPDSLSEDTVLILLNAIYFKGVWANPFSKRATRVGKFKPSAGKEIDVSYMNLRSEEFRADEDLNLKVKWVELPFEGGDYSMVIILPTEENGLNDLIGRLTPEDFEKILKSEETRHVTMKLPRFKIDYKTSLTEALKKMGLIEIFETTANLKGISASDESLFVSDLIHRAEIEVNEEGSTASAATGLLINTLSLYSDEMSFDVEQPFLVVVLDKINNIPLFIGRICEPETV